VAGEGLLLAALIAAFGFALFRPREPARQAVPDPPEPFYHRYTASFDRVCRGSEMLAVLAADGKDTRAGRVVGPADPLERQRLFDEARAGVGLLPRVELRDTGITILVDQSGSMAPLMPRIAGELLAACEHLEAAGAQVMLAGFTTVGWRGGQSRALWENKGRPRYPGRLCDLLHVIYSDFCEVSTPSLVKPLLETGIFFENVDGEAILWAEKRLLAAPLTRRCLIVVSDGAPVDDSSLKENGPHFLWNHLVDTLSGLRSRGQIAVGAVGIDHDVSSLYSRSRGVSANGGLAAALAEIAGELADSEGGAA
jgi:cobaltochelatase CobT